MALKPFNIEAGEIPRYTYGDYKLWEGNWELIKGYPYAMSPSPNRKHQGIGKNLISYFDKSLSETTIDCNCEVFYELDWIMNEETVVRPDIMIICGKFETDFLTFAPTLIVEISSGSTKMKDRNTKFRLYESAGVKYYLIADTEKETVEIFELIENQYKQNDTLQLFQLTNSCSIEINTTNLWH
jgi:Uma2 family endonuclease